MQFFFPTSNHLLSPRNFGDITLPFFLSALLVLFAPKRKTLEPYSAAFLNGLDLSASVLFTLFQGIALIFLFPQGLVPFGSGSPPPLLIQRQDFVFLADFPLPRIPPDIRPHFCFVLRQADGHFPTGIFCVTLLLSLLMTFFSQHVCVTVSFPYLR